MGSSEIDKSSKEAKETKEPKTPTSQAQEQPSATSTGTPDWSGFQAYSPMPPHGYLASGPQAHPYMWGVQHLMTPYGTPPHPYVAMYPHGGIYAHPGSYPFSPFPVPPNGMAEPSVNTPGNAELDGKSSEGKEKLPIKRSKGSLGSLNMITGKNSEPGKTSGASANGGYSKSAESGSEGSSEGSDANSQNESQMKSGNRQDSGDTSQNGNSGHGSQNGGTNTPPIVSSMALVPFSAAPVVQGGVAGPPTNLNIGMEYWGTAASPTVPIMRGKVQSTPVGGGMVPARDGVQSQLWLQDEREMKRQRRKQSNRESARRSRLRKQAECDELAQRSEALQEENLSLKAELSRIKSAHELLIAENRSLKERCGEVAAGSDDPRSSRKEEQHSTKEKSTPRGQ